MSEILSPLPIDERLKLAIEASPAFSVTRRWVYKDLDYTLQSKPSTVAGLAERQDLIREGSFFIIDQERLSPENLSFVVNLTTRFSCEVGVGFFRTLEAYILFIGIEGSVISSSFQKDIITTLAHDYLSFLHTHTSRGFFVPSIEDQAAAKQYPEVRHFLGINPSFYREGYDRYNSWLFREFSAGHDTFELLDLSQMADLLNLIAQGQIPRSEV